MKCPNCNDIMEESTSKSYECKTCYKIVILCDICNIIMDNPNSNICGHPTCIEKKMRGMFNESPPKKERKKNDY